MGRIALVIALFAGCSSEEAPRLAVPLVVDASGLAPVTTDRGDLVTVTRMRAALRDFRFTTGGQAHAWRWLLPRAHAHPGHLTGGEVTGELAGPVVVDLADDGAAIGTAVLIPGDYRGAELTLRRPDAQASHTFEIEGSVAREGRVRPFTALVDLDEDIRLVGAPFQHRVAKDAQVVLGLRFLPVGAMGTVFDGLAFEGDDPITIRAGTEAHNRLRRALQVHDRWEVRVR